jgi:hypothetical protein
MSLLHKPTYTFDYDEIDDTEGLSKLRWSQFMCKCGKCDVRTGKMFMERNPVLFLDGIAREEQLRFTIELGYVCQSAADKIHSLPTRDSHRVGLAVKIKVSVASKRMKILRGLIYRGVSRIGINEKFIYFDCDDLKGQALYIR